MELNSLSLRQQRAAIHALVLLPAVVSYLTEFALFFTCLYTESHVRKILHANAMEKNLM